MESVHLPYVEVLRDIMWENKYSQATMAEILGVNQTTISQWLLGNKKPGYDSIMLIYEKFGIEPNVLFGIE